MPIKSSIGQAHTHTHSLSHASIPNQHEERKMKFQRPALSRLREEKKPRQQRRTQEKKTIKTKKKKEPICGLKMRADHLLLQFIDFTFPSLVVLCFSWSVRIYPFIVHLDKEFNKIEYLQSQITIDFSALFRFVFFPSFCYWAVILFFLFQSIDLIKSDGEKEIPSCARAQKLWRCLKSHSAQEKSSDRNMWSKPH